MNFYLKFTMIMELLSHSGGDRKCASVYQHHNFLKNRRTCLTDPVSLKGGPKKTTPLKNSYNFVQAENVFFKNFALVEEESLLNATKFRQKILSRNKVMTS